MFFLFEFLTPLLRWFGVVFDSPALRAPPQEGDAYRTLACRTMPDAALRLHRVDVVPPFQGWALLPLPLRARIALRVPLLRGSGGLKSSHHKSPRQVPNTDEIHAMGQIGNIDPLVLSGDGA